MAGAAQIQIGQAGGALYMRVVGPATSVLGPCLQKLLSRGADGSVSQILVDLSASPIMDSTICGCLISYAMGCRSGRQAPIRLVRPSPGCRRSILNLHVEAILSITDEPVAAPDELHAVPVEALDPDAQTEQMILAHRRLCEADDRNRIVFGRIVETLEKNLADSRLGGAAYLSQTRAQP